MNAQLQHGKECQGRRMGSFRTAYSVMLDVVANQALHLRSERIRSAYLRAHEERPILTKTTEIAASWMFNSGEMLWRLAKMLHALAWKAAVRLGIRDLLYQRKELTTLDGTPFIIRPFHRSDAADCSCVIRGADARRLFRMDAERLEGFIFRTTEDKMAGYARRYDYFVAETNGRVIGMVGLKRWSWDDGEPVDFAVDPDYQRLGIGTALAASYALQKQLEGVEYISTRCFERSRRILLKFGFRDRGVDGESCGEPLYRMSAFLTPEVMMLVRGELAGRPGHS